MINANYNADRLKRLSKEVYDYATARGFHERPLSERNYLGMIMTEVAEAVEADRKDDRAKTANLLEVIETQRNSDYGLTQGWYEMWFGVYYDSYVKGSLEEEFADIVIRILDMAYGIHGDKMEWVGYYPYGEAYREKDSFIENAWYFVHDVLNSGTMNIADSVSFMYAWAEHLDIDIDKHIDWKMKYNEVHVYENVEKKY